MSEHDEERNRERRSEARGTDAPRAMSFTDYQFNFKVDLGARIAAQYGGAPAFSIRRAKLQRDTDSFWGALEHKYEELWTAAREGRIDEEGREVRQNLLDASGSDRLGKRDHLKRLFSRKLDPEEHAREEFNRAWLRQLDHCGIDALAREVEDFCKYFPVESGMPVDPVTDQFLWMGEPWVPPEPPSREGILHRFPLR